MAKKEAGTVDVQKVVIPLGCRKQFSILHLFTTNWKKNFMSGMVSTAFRARLKSYKKKSQLCKSLSDIQLKP